MNERDEAIKGLNMALTAPGPGALRERMLHDAAVLARRVLLADEKLVAFVERAGLTSAFGRLDAREVDELNAILGAHPHSKDWRDDPANAWCKVCDRGLEGCAHEPSELESGS